MDTRTKAFFIIMGIICVVIFLVLVYAVLRRPQGSRIIPILPNPSRVEVITTPATHQLSLVAVDPQEDPTGKNNYGPTKTVTLSFNKPLDSKTIQVSVSPIHATTIALDSTGQKIIIDPTAPFFWEPDILYTITVSAGLKALDGSLLQRDVNYKIQTKLPPGGGD